MKAQTIDGITYDAGAVQNLRAEMIRLRDEALAQTEFDWAVMLSHVIAALGCYRDELAKDEHLLTATKKECAALREALQKIKDVLWKAHTGHGICRDEAITLDKWLSKVLASERNNL